MHTASEEMAAVVDRLLQSAGARLHRALQLHAARTSAPVVVAVISSPKDDGRTPVWEQELSAGAVCYNLLLAANASGWAGAWLSEWPAFDAKVAEALGLSATERVAGFMYLGTSKIAPAERGRANMSEIITRWSR